MRPVGIITAFVFTAAVVVTGCTAQATADHRSAAPAPAVAAPATTALPAFSDRKQSPSLKLTPRSTQATRTTSGHRQTPRPTPTTSAPRGLHFDTPEGAMRYLARAYNRIDLTALKHVTTPEARANLVAMRATAVNLQLVSCTFNASRGDYLCAFTHDFPASMHQTGTGHAHFTAAPADRIGWYMTVLNDCG
jgi:hypothetical protein